jgi:hypothetical protein
MSNYFQDFPVVDYRFGDEETNTRFQHLGTAVDILEQVKKYSVYYNTYEIQNGERPEQLSYKLYDDVNYYWTFYLLNDHLRQSGWPLRDALVWEYVQKYYPNTVLQTPAVTQPKQPKIIDTGNDFFLKWVVTGAQVPLCQSNEFLVGAPIWFEATNVVGRILKIDHQTGFIYTDAKGLRSVDNVVHVIKEDDYDIHVGTDGEIVPSSLIAESPVDKIYDEYDAPHHWEDTEGNWIYPTPSKVHPFGLDHDNLRGWDTEDRKWYNASSGATVNSISNGQKIVELNQRQKTISVIKKDSIRQVVNEFDRLLRQ